MPEPMIPRRPARRATAIQAERIALLSSLEPLDWRLLSWLLRYPFQRADDLVVGMARWTSRATVYRHLQRLVQRELVASVVPKTPAEGKRLYHLSNLGLHVLAAHLGTSASTLARDWHTDDAGLLRLVPRLPTLLFLQDLVNGLVTHAADALTTQGRRPTLVRWNWQRDLLHRFRYREQPLRLFVDGAVALCIERAQGDGKREAHWYGLLLLTTDLEDERVMRQRLERVLCWRECPERWVRYQQMLPVMILAHSSRQCDHWQQAMTQAAHQLRVEPLVGATACISNRDGESQMSHPWRQHWRTLSTGLDCHLQDLLHPVPETALPPALRADGDAMTSDSHHGPSPVHPTVSVSPTSLPARLSRIIREPLADGSVVGTQEQHGGNEPETLAWLAWRVTPGQWQLLYLLLSHPLLAPAELALLLSLQRQSVRCALSALHQRGCITPVATAVGQRWHLAPRGLHLVAAANRVPVRAIATVPDAVPTAEVPTVVQRGVAWLLHHIPHTAGVYSFFAHLAQAARQQPDQALCWWETGVQCERRYRVNEQWYNLRPDALAAYTTGQRQLLFWLEWDRGTMNVRDLTVKFTAYAHYLASREWGRDHPSVPMLVCVTPDIAQEQRIVRVAQATLAQMQGFVLSTTTAPFLAEYGPLAAIWLPVLPQHQSSEGRPRQALFTVNDYHLTDGC
ncbi:MAG TPA: replication-relaxation family protein [Ktedonobacteraceae bacterium]|nr:replication-relaxation family protein [Ktedonobacteraceae bacterium]